MAAPLVFGFVGTDANVGAYFVPHIFAGTPFEQAPVLNASIEIDITVNRAKAKCVAGDNTFEVKMNEFSEPY